MLLEELEARNFRNLEGGIEFQPGLNILVGENGQGKTNWLEAIYLLASARSFKTTKLVEAVEFGEDLGIIRGRVRRTEEIHRDLQVTINKNIKALWVNSKQIPAREYHGQLHAALFTSDALEIVRGGPDERRRFLDEIIVSIHPPYSQTASDYLRVIRQKNTLLQTAKDRELSLEETAEQLQPWNEQLAGLATRIHRSRVRIVERLNSELLQSVFQKEELTLHYISSLEGKGDLENYQDLITERLKLRVQAERTAGYSLIGPHRDECEIRFDGRDIRKFGSSGQQRSALLSLQIANIAVFWAQQNEYPLFLIDDIDAELDHDRIGQLLEFLEGKTQTIITTSKFDLARSLGSKASVFSVFNGKASVSL
jgi:DNA replication and repair protein RecF